MSIGLIGAGISSLLQIVQQATAPAPAPAPAPVAQPAVQPATGLGNLGQGSPLQKKIRDAVTAALQNPANATTDPNKVIEQAITNVLTGHDTTVPSLDTTDWQTQKTQFDALLRSKGVDSSQFHADFLAAMVDAKAAGGGTTDYSKILKNVPPGWTLDTVA